MASRAHTPAQNEMAPTIMRVSGRREGWSSGSMERMQVQRARGQDNRQKKTTAHKIVYIRILVVAIISFNKGPLNSVVGVACPCLHMCTPCRRLVGRRIPNESKSKELVRSPLSPCTALHSSLHDTQACPSTGTGHPDSQRTQPFHKVM